MVRYNLTQHTTMFRRMRFTSSIFLKSNRTSRYRSKDQKQTFTFTSGLCACFCDAGLLLCGGAGRDRTDDPLLAKQVLSQLSYSPSSVRHSGCSSRAAAVPKPCWVVGLDGFEPSTPALSRRCSNQLSYRPVSGIRWPLVLRGNNR